MEIKRLKAEKRIVKGKAKKLYPIVNRYSTSTMEYLCHYRVHKNHTFTVFLKRSVSFFGTGGHDVPFIVL